MNTIENSNNNSGSIKGNSNSNSNGNIPPRYNKLSTPESKQLFGQIFNLEFKKIDKSGYDKLKHVSCNNKDITSPQSIYSKRFYLDLISVRNYLHVDHGVRKTKNHFYLIKKNVNQQQLDKLNSELIELLASKKRKINTAKENKKVKQLKIDNQQLNNNYQQLNNDYQQLNNDYQQLNKKMEQLKQKKSHDQNTIIQFKNKEEELKNQYEQLQIHSNNQYQQLQIQSNYQYQQLKQEMDQVTRQLDQCRETIGSLETCVDETNKLLDQVTKKRDQVAKERDEAIKRVQILECGIKKYEDARHNSINQHIVKLKESFVSKVVNGKKDTYDIHKFPKPVEVLSKLDAHFYFKDVQADQFYKFIHHYYDIKDSDIQVGEKKKHFGGTSYCYCSGSRSFISPSCKLEELKQRHSYCQSCAIFSKYVLNKEYYFGRLKFEEGEIEEGGYQVSDELNNTSNELVDQLMELLKRDPDFKDSFIYTFISDIIKTLFKGTGTWSEATLHFARSLKFLFGKKVIEFLNGNKSKRNKYGGIPFPSLSTVHNFFHNKSDYYSNEMNARFKALRDSLDKMEEYKGRPYFAGVVFDEIDTLKGPIDRSNLDNISMEKIDDNLTRKITQFFLVGLDGNISFSLARFPNNGKNTLLVSGLAIVDIIKTASKYNIKIVFGAMDGFDTTDFIHNFIHKQANVLDLADPNGDFHIIYDSVHMVKSLRNLIIQKTPLKNKISANELHPSDRMSLRPVKTLFSEYVEAYFRGETQKSKNDIQSQQFNSIADYLKNLRKFYNITNGSELANVENSLIELEEVFNYFTAFEGLPKPTKTHLNRTIGSLKKLFELAKRNDIKINKLSHLGTNIKSKHNFNSLLDLKLKAGDTDKGTSALESVINGFSAISLKKIFGEDIKKNLENNVEGKMKKAEYVKVISDYLKDNRSQVTTVVNKLKEDNRIVKKNRNEKKLENKTKE
ncbi:hypothetical protein DICPUDRAFT_157740 [Dictyostelium purpureum]|uniref:Uncharacterized protein n=1 Tax=Dictyostelium purpureum TaxID=5786 RepID=F0ZZV9_DICPU|nr:uncharacterized protein DICPUDRAFT_157740 [Dictyostelium purpureum]EGC30531.1 hypothetical protein DICPUDRAFT_157740 [Dictyostelium purpureum]|eukprot:XP_003292954.1 hypothetical protein DICPUDRAFT_157740 [Dictyostelium purpureum]